ncbi:hypothetical protein LCGC14_2435220, partial [marine sediment metagenome]
HRREPLTALLEMGLDVLSEKPMAANLAEAEEFVALAAKHGRTFMVSFNRRFMPAYLKAKEFIADRPILICRAWKHRGMLWAHSIHVIDVLRWFCGEPVAIQADGNFDDEGRETAAAGLVRFDSGAIALFETCASYGRRQEEFVAHGKKFTVEVLSPYKTVMAEDDTGSQTVYRHGSNAWYCQAQEQYGFVGQIRHFLDAVANGSVPTSVASEAIKSHRLAHDLLAAALDGDGRDEIIVRNKDGALLLFRPPADPASSWPVGRPLSVQTAPNGQPRPERSGFSVVELTRTACKRRPSRRTGDRSAGTVDTVAARRRGGSGGPR